MENKNKSKSNLRVAFIKHKRKMEELEFMKEFYKSSKVWGVSLYMLGTGIIVSSSLILIFKNIYDLFSLLFIGIICILVGAYYLISYETDIY